jgi:hypothetical protein
VCSHSVLDATANVEQSYTRRDRWVGQNRTFALQRRNAHCTEHENYKSQDDRSEQDAEIARSEVKLERPAHGGPM